MCIIAIKKIGVPAPDESTLETMFQNNPDGAGFMYNHNGQVIIEKGYMTFESFMLALEKAYERVDVTNTGFVYHFRIATHGAVKPALCHPFPVTGRVSALKKLNTMTDLGIAHNGIINIMPRKGLSDTMEYILSKLYDKKRRNPNFYKSKRERKVIYSEIKSKMAFLDGNGNVYTVGDFTQENGILYSNTSYQTMQRFFFNSDFLDTVKASPLSDGYILLDNGKMQECCDGTFLVDTYGTVYEYDSYFDFAFSVQGTAYSHYGLPSRFQEEKSIHIPVL